MYCLHLIVLQPDRKVWDNGGNCLLQRLQKIQNRAARVITGKSYEVRSSEILRELDWQTLEKRRKCNKAIFMYKIKHTNEPPQCMANLLNVNNNTIGITLFGYIFEYNLIWKNNTRYNPIN